MTRRAVRRTLLFLVALFLVACMWELYKAVGPDTGGAFLGIPLAKTNDHAMPHTWDMISRLNKPENRAGGQAIWRSVLGYAWYSFRLSAFGLGQQLEGVERRRLCLDELVGPSTHDNAFVSRCTAQELHRAGRSVRNQRLTKWRRDRNASSTSGIGIDDDAVALPRQSPRHRRLAARRRPCNKNDPFGVASPHLPRWTPFSYSLQVPARAP